MSKSYYDYRITFSFFFPLRSPNSFFFFYFRFWEHAVPCIRDRKWIESALLRKILRCTMRCHDVSSSCLRTRSSIKVFWEWFFFFSFHTSNAQKNAFPCAPTWYTIRVYIYIYHPRDIFYLDAYTIFIYCVFCTYYYYYTSLWTSFRFLPGNFANFLFV